MKANTVVCPKPAELTLRQDQYRISRARLDTSDPEVCACLSKLRDMVPTVPQDRRISKVQLLQHVIDYILDLELTLDTEGARALSADRRPLAENTLLNTRPHLLVGNGLAPTRPQETDPILLIATISHPPPFHKSSCHLSLGWFPPEYYWYICLVPRPPFWMLGMTFVRNNSNNTEKCKSFISILTLLIDSMTR